jgi:TatD DNase family protein
MMWIDTHAHLDAAEFGHSRRDVQARSLEAGVRCIVIPAVEPGNFSAVRTLAHASANVYALGVHPLFVEKTSESDLDALRADVQDAMADPQFVAIGEIGLDFFVPNVDRARQIWWYEGQLRIAREFGLPVLLHVRKSQDALLAGLRRSGWASADLGGIAHAFNGSRQQADGFIAQGLRLGFGGAMTFERARNIRSLAANLPQERLVLETDAPDIPPEWLVRQNPPPFNEPAQLPRIAQTLCALRGWTPSQAASITTANARAALPRLAAWLDARGNMQG